MRKEVYLFGIIFLVLSLSLVSAVWWNPWTWFEKPLLEPVTPNCVGNYIGEIGLNDCAQVNTSDCGNSYIGAYGTYSQCGIDQGVCSMVNSFACNGPSIASICTPNCVNRNCGPDGCLGGSCGTCAEDEKCNDGICEETCIPKTCGHNEFNCNIRSDGCGGWITCYSCEEGKTCMFGRCYLNAQNNGHLINTLLIGLNIPDKDELVNNAIADFIKNWVIS